MIYIVEIVEEYLESKKNKDSEDYEMISLCRKEFKTQEEIEGIIDFYDGVING